MQGETSNSSPHGSEADRPLEEPALETGSAQSRGGPETAPPPAGPSAEVRDDPVKICEDRYRRLYAEFENYRRRAQREKNEAAEAARGEVIRDVLGALDHVEKALRSGRDHDVPAAFLEGLRLIEAEFKSALARWGVQEVSAGGTFDVLWHEAVGCQLSDEVPEGKIVAVTRKGYRLGDRLLRPAQVIVSAGPSEAPPVEWSEEGKPNASTGVGAEESDGPPPNPSM